MKEKKECTKKQKFKERGVTLIALVITIIVLLILAGVALAMLTGDSGILSNAEKAKENTLEANAREKVQIAIMEHKIGKYSEGKTLKEYLEAAGATDVTEAGTKGKIDGYNFEIVDGVVTLTKGTLGTQELTLRDVYKDEMIGQKITYSANNQENWIVFGKDTYGNILITTALPIDNAFELKGGVASWLSYTDDLDEVCGVYGGTIQETEVTARSITMDDINYVAGFTKPTFETFTFGSTHGWNSETEKWDSNNVNYYYPSTSETAVDNWENPATKPETFDNDWYGYKYNSDEEKYVYFGADTNGNEVPAEQRDINVENLKYIWGGNTEETAYNPYAVASRSVRVNSDRALFSVANVGNSDAFAIRYLLCISRAGGGGGTGSFGSLGVRPIVVLPSSLKVEINAEGLYDLVQ